MKKAENKINEKSLQVLSCALAVAVMLLLLFGDMIISRFIPLNPNQNSVKEEKEDETVTKVLESNDYDVSFMNEVSLNRALSDIQTGNLVFLFSGRSTCGPCRSFVPVLKEVYQDLNITSGLYLDRNSITSGTEGYDMFVSQSEILQSNFGSTPLFLLFKNGTFQDYILGMRGDSSELKNLLKEKIQKYL